MTFATFLGLAKPTVPATFHTSRAEAVLGDLRLKDGEAVEIVAQPLEGSAMVIEIRSRGKSLFFEVDETNAFGFARPADKDFDIPVRGRMKRTPTDMPTAACAAQKAYNWSTLFVDHPECDEKIRAVEATFTMEFEGVGRIETWTALISK